VEAFNIFSQNVSGDRFYGCYILTLDDFSVSIPKKIRILVRSIFGQDKVVVFLRPAENIDTK